MSVSFKSNLPAVTAAFERAGKAAMTAGIENMRGMTVKNLKQAGTGRTYRVPGTQRTYTASAPGEFPAVRLGTLSGPAGVETEVKTDGTSVTASIGSRVKYGLYLEKKPASKGGRPWLKRTLDENRDAIYAGFEKGWAAALKKEGM
ncbi:MAG: hypothetical protein M0R22_01090 [Dehalococcoidia bacterium]|jgi:hypothetical protein|nr:hypothetical protein [Dehalococcoidia bacterium]